VGSTTGIDVIDLGGGTNILVASSGAAISVTTGSGDDTITTGSGDDSISSGAGNDTIAAGAGNNTIVTGDGVKTITAGAGNDAVTVGSTSGTDIIDLGNGANILVASSGATISVSTGSGNDTITTGVGDDSISSGAGNDTIIAGAGANIIVTGDGDKAITTGSGNDTITTGAGSNVVWAGDGTNTVTGGGGADTLVGGTGADTLTGGGGGDWFYAGTGANTVDGGTGDDWLSFNGVGSGVTSGTYSLANWLSNPGTDISGVTLTLDATGGGTATRALGQVDKVLGIEDIIGSSGDDKFDVSAYTGVSHTLYGLDGNDVLIGGDMADTIYGGAGQDSIWGNAGNDVIYLAITGTGSTALAGTASDAAGAGTLSYSVTANGVTFSASNLYNIANGGAGADTIVGGDGNDLFISGLNEYSDGTRSDTFVGGAGNDVLDLSAQTIALKVDMTGGYATSGGSDVARFSDIEVILTGSGDDDITGSSGADTIYAGNGVNTVTAGGGNDIIRTGSGNDIIYAGQGSDTVWAGAGDDKIWANINTSSANGGSDTLFGGAGNDSLISSTTGTDTLTLYGEDDTTGTVGTNYTNTYFLYAAVERVYGATYSTDWITYGSSGAGQGTTYGVYVNLSDTNYGVGSTGALVQDATSSYWWSGAAGVAMTSGAGGAWSATNAGSGFYGHAQGDTYVSIENITGSNYADILIGNASNNVFYASTGNDGLYGLGGDDYFYITSGSKYVDGGTDNGQTATATAAGALTFSGGDTVEYSGNYSQTVNLDTVSHTVGTLTLAANQINTYTSGLVGVTPVYNVENYVGASGVDIVWGTDGDNRIDPRYGNDTVFAGGGNDVVLAGSGDAANVSTPSGADYLDGGSGIDWVSYAGISGAGATGLGIEAYLADADMNADGAADQIVSGTWAANTGYARFKVDSSSSQIDTLVNFENLQGSGQADILAGDAGANVIFGEAGNDTIYGGLGAAGVIDTLDGGAGSDLLSFYGYTLGVRVDMSTTNGLTILGNAGWSTATMTDGSTVAYLRNFENLRGSAQADTLVGSSGANIFYGSGGADTMSGGGGNDTFFLSSAQISQAAVLDGGANTDRVTATDTWTFSAGSFDTAKWISIEELYARNTAADNAFSLGAADIRAICDNGNNSSLTLYLDTGDKFTVATDAVGTSANYSFTNGGTLAAGSYSVVYKSGATSVATLTLQVA
jgi:Ca2+-binding RTX toxin-like protein